MLAGELTEADASERYLRPRLALARVIKHNDRNDEIELRASSEPGLFTLPRIAGPLSAALASALSPLFLSRERRKNFASKSGQTERLARPPRLARNNRQCCLLAMAAAFVGLSFGFRPAFVAAARISGARSGRRRANCCGSRRASRTLKAAACASHKLVQQTKQLPARANKSTAAQQIGAHATRATTHSTAAIGHLSFALDHQSRAGGRAARARRPSLLQLANRGLLAATQPALGQPTNWPSEKALDRYGTACVLNLINCRLSGARAHSKPAGLPSGLGQWRQSEPRDRMHRLIYWPSASPGPDAKSRPACAGSGARSRKPQDKNLSKARSRGALNFHTPPRVSSSAPGWPIPVSGALAHAI